jgi:hypothetical protein
MNIRDIHGPGPELGALSAIASFVGAFALLGFVLLGDGTEVPSGAVPAAASPAASYEGGDPSVPPASSVFGNRADEPAPQVETF